MLLWIPSNWNKLCKKKTINRTLSEIFIFAINLQNIFKWDNLVHHHINMFQLQNERSAGRISRLWYFTITAVHAERWWKVANCCNRLQWVDCICFGPAVKNIIGYGPIPYPPLDFSKFVGSGTLPWRPPIIKLLAVITEVAEWGTPSCSPATDNIVRDGRSNWLVALPTLMGSTPWAPRA